MQEWRPGPARLWRLAAVILSALLMMGVSGCGKGVQGRTLHVEAGAGDGGDGSVSRPFTDIGAALDRAEPGDRVEVGEGTYPPFVTRRSGTSEASVVVEGDGARIVGSGDGRVVEVNHSFVSIEGFEISDGDVLVRIAGADGVRLIGNTLHDASSECVRIRDGASQGEVADNRIERCGLEDFDLDADRKNGEGIYIGVAPEQLEDGEEAAANENWIHDNRISTPAECIDIKERSERTLVERNQCTGGEDPEGGGFSSRGNETIFRDNSSTGHEGAGIRLGGDDDDDGVNNDVVGNRLMDNRGYGLKVERFPQGMICGNQVDGNGDGPTNGRVEPDQGCEDDSG